MEMDTHMYMYVHTHKWPNFDHFCESICDLICETTTVLTYHKTVLQTYIIVMHT